MTWYDDYKKGSSDYPSTDDIDPEVIANGTVSFDAMENLLGYDPWEDVENRIAYEQMLAKMTEQEQDILRLYIEQDLTIREIAIEIGISKSRVGEILKAKLNELKDEICQ